MAIAKDVDTQSLANDGMSVAPLQSLAPLANVVMKKTAGAHHVCTLKSDQDVYVISAGKPQHSAWEKIKDDSNLIGFWFVLNDTSENDSNMHIVKKSSMISRST